MTLLYILLILVIVLVSILIILNLKGSKTSINGIESKDVINPIKEELDRNSKIINDSSYSLQSRISRDFNDLVIRLNESINNKMKEGFSNTENVIKEFKDRLVSIDNEQKRIIELNDQIKGLEKILGNNKQTGNFGEGLLEEVLFAYFGDDPNLYQTQYTIPKVCRKDGTKYVPDSVIFMPKEIVCIDSKFPVHFYQEFLNVDNDIDRATTFKLLKEATKKQINEVSEYIIKGITSDYACMFIPSDSLSSLIHKQMGDLIDYSRSKHVIILSPSTVNPFVSSIRNVKLDYERNENVEELYNSLSNLSKEFGYFKERWDKVLERIDQLVDASKTLDITANKIQKNFKDIDNMNLKDKDS